MCNRIAAFREALEDYAERFDAALITAAAARVADTSLWRRSGSRTPAEHLARCSGSTLGQAADALSTARRLRHLPAARYAARGGRLSSAQASAIAGAAGADPSAEKHLVETAGHASLQHLRDDCARVRAAADDGVEARRRRIHTERSLRRSSDAEGAFKLHLRDTAKVGAARARAEGRPERRESATPPTPKTVANPARPTTAAGRGLGPAGGLRPRSWCASTCPPRCGPTPSTTSAARSWASARWPSRPRPLPHPGHAGAGRAPPAA